MNDYCLSIELAHPLEVPDRTRLERALATLLPQGRHKLLRLREDEPLPTHARIYLAVDTPPAGLDQHPNLTSIQACSAGADAFLSLPNVRNGSVRLTSASGLHSVIIAEFVIAPMINLMWRTDRLWSLMQAWQWPSPSVHCAVPVLRGQTVAIFGYGSAGRELLPRLKLPEPWRTSPTSSLTMVDELNIRIATCVAELRTLGADHPSIPLVMAVLGVG